MRVTPGCGAVQPMSNRSKMAERLLAHATMCQDAASLCWNEDIAFELEKLAEDCRHAAHACEAEFIHATPALLAH